LLGHLPQFKAGPKHQVLEHWVAECGDLFRIHFAGKPFVVSADPQINGEILRQRPAAFQRYAKISEILEEMGILGVFNAEGEQWKRLRKPTAEALNLRKTKAFYPIIGRKAQQLIERWNDYASHDQTIDVTKEIMRFTIDVTTAVAFGYPLDTLGGQDDVFQQHLELIFPMVNQRMSAAIPWWRWIKTGKDKKLDEALKAIQALIHTFIEEARDRLEQQPERKEHPANFLEALLVEQKQEGFSEQEIYSTIFTLLLAGEDTTANSISWAIYFLARHPEIVEKVRAEALAVYSHQNVPDSTGQLDQLEYALAVAQETIRLKPTSPQLIMQATEDIQVGPLFLPKGTNIFLQNKVAQTREAHFSDADQFVPDRWLKGGCPAHYNHSSELIRAFGGGPRFCPGKHLATYEMVTVISALCYHFGFSLEGNPEKVKEGFAFTMHPEGLMVRIDIKKR